MALLGSRVQFTLTRLQALPSPRLVLVIRIVFLVLDSQSLGLFHKRPLLALGEQPGQSGEKSSILKQFSVSETKGPDCDVRWCRCS